MGKMKHKSDSLRIYTYTR